MDNKKQIVTLTDIKEHFLEECRRSVISLTCTFMLFGLLSFIVKAPVAKAIMVVLCLLSLWGVGHCVYCIYRIRRNTYFHVRTDILISKNIQHHPAQKDGTSYRLCFCKGHYEMYMHRTGSLGMFDGSDGVWYDIYDMGSKTIYDTAFIGDSFTLVCVGKRIVLAFNNNYFDVQNDL